MQSDIRKLIYNFIWSSIIKSDSSTMMTAIGPRGNTGIEGRSDPTSRHEIHCISRGKGTLQFRGTKREEHVGTNTQLTIT